MSCHEVRCSEKWSIRGSLSTGTNRMSYRDSLWKFKPTTRGVTASYTHNLPTHQPKGSSTILPLCWECFLLTQTYSVPRERPIVWHVVLKKKQQQQQHEPWDTGMIKLFPWNTQVSKKSNKSAPKTTSWGSYSCSLEPAWTHGRRWPEGTWWERR